MSRFHLRSFADRSPLVLGILTLVAAFIAVVLAFAIGTLGILEDRYEMSGVFEESGGIRPGDKVRVAGLDVGEVTSVRPDFQEAQVVVTWEVDRGVDLGADTSAEISLATLLGGRYLRLDGPVTEPYVADLPTEERRIPIERTRLPIGVQDALGRFTDAADAYDVDQIDQLLQNFADISADNADSFEPLVENITVLASVLNERRGQIDSLLQNTTELTSALASKDQELLTLIDQSGRLLDVVAQRRDQLRAVLGSGSQAVSELDRLITANRESLDTLLADFDITADTLRARLPELNELLAYVGPAVQGLDEATRSGPWLDSIVSGTGLVQVPDLIESGG
ncbi:MAG TPA: MlaD family protein [Acidimicrobiales bacterium]|nr:MlaD family protein [Acidimicrobiales bacterium]